MTPEEQIAALERESRQQWEVINKLVEALRFGMTARALRELRDMIPAPRTEGQEADRG